jgi:flagellar hook-basal body complex protein FliE
MGSSILGLPPLNLDQLTSQIGTTGGVGSSNGPEFMDTLKKSLDQVQQVQNEADQKVSDLVTGRGGNIDSAMIAVQKANLSFELVMQVRNKIVQAYQEVENLQF